MQPKNQHSVVQYLKIELQKRKKTKPGYSTKSFAKDLEIDHSRLLKILTVEAGSLAERNLNEADEDKDHLVPMEVRSFIG